MNIVRITRGALVIATLAAHLYSAQAQTPEIHRTDLARHDLSVPGREGIQVRVDFDASDLMTICPVWPYCVRR